MTTPDVTTPDRTGGVDAEFLLDADDTLTGERDDDTLADEEPESDDNAPSVVALAQGRQRLQLDDTLVGVHSGEALTAAEATVVMEQHPVELVVAVAEAEAGKTTLFASIYEQMARAPLAGWAFDSSLSLFGFEGRSFDATHESGHAVEQMQRTSRNTNRVALHVCVRDAEGHKRHLLFGDVSGEHARALIEFNDPVDYRPLLRSATRVLVLIDGAKLLTPSAQNTALTRARTLLRAVAEGGDLRPGTPLDLIVTKWDQCSGAEGLPAELDRLLSFAKQIWHPIALHQTAARPEGMGIPELFGVLLAPRPARAARRWNAPPPRRPLHRFVAPAGIASRFLAGRDAGRTT